MKIGDLFWAFRGQGTQLQADAKTEGAKAGAILGQSITAGVKKSFSGANIGKGLVQGLGLAGALGGAQLAATAISKLTDVIGDSIQAALADEESQNRLGASLKANVPGWDGNTKAIEANILAKQRLGFQDETLRDSLTILVGATHDVTKAQEIMNTAMDLSRFKGIDLKTASEALIKVEGGVYRSLKGLGIVLRDGATQTEALAAVQKVAAGQAEAYALTNRGKLEASQIKLGEAMENFGGTIMPAVVEIMTAAGDVATDLGGDLQGLGKNAQTAAQILKDLGIITVGTTDSGIDLVHAVQDFLAVTNPTKISGTVGVLLDTIDKLGLSTEEGRKLFKSWGLDVPTALDRVKDDAGDMSHAAYDAFHSMQTDLKDTGKASEDFRDKFRDVAGAIIRSSHRVRDALIKDAALVRGDVFDETEIRASLHDQRLALFDLQRQRSAAKTAEAQRQASDDIAQALDDEGQSLEDLAGQGKLTQRDVDRFTKDAKANYAALSKDGRAKIDALIATYQALVDMPNVHKTVTVTYNQKITGHAPGTGPLQFGATGGRFPAGTNLVTGENGWEMMRLLPGGGAQVLSNAESVRAVDSATGPDVGDIHVHLEDRLAVRSVRDIGDGLRMLERRGYMRRRRAGVN